MNLLAANSMGLYRETEIKFIFWTALS
jgi:hypothetical protein